MKAILSMKARTFLTLALLPLLLTGCNKGAPLPGGYAIFIASGEETLLVDKQSGGVAGANLVQIGNSGALIFGEIQLMPARPAKDSDTPGFFILDSTTGAIEKGLSREDWLKKLQKAGIQGEPDLVYPGRKAPRK
jgi:hypothetical protein